MLLNSVWKPSPGVFGGYGGVVFSLLIGQIICVTALAAAPLDQTLDLRGAPISQQFLPGGASIVTTTDMRACVVSSRIGIEASVYTAADGTVVPFDQIRRSIAASVQVVQPLGVDQTGFRIQLKFSPAPGTPILLTLEGQRRDLQDMLEPSSDSLWISGDMAVALQAAFVAGARPVLHSTSADTGHLVTDRLDAPDLAALAQCRVVLADTAPSPAAPTAAVLPLSNEIRVSFQADPATTPLATLPDLRTCGMTDAPGVLHLARLDSVTGFFAQTDKVFVAFAADGTLAQVYIPGILDGDFRDGGHRVRLSQAADSNLPTVQNDMKGCLGAATVPVCHYDLAHGGHLLGACIGTDGPDGDFVPETIASYEPGSTSTGPTLGGGGSSGGGSSGGGSGFTPGGFTPAPGGGPDKIDEVGGETGGGGGGGGGPSPVPVPAPFMLLAAALIGLAGLRRRV